MITVSSSAKSLLPFLHQRHFHLDSGTGLMLWNINVNFEECYTPAGLDPSFEIKPGDRLSVQFIAPTI